MAVDQATFEEKAHNDPYAMMDSEDNEYLAQLPIKTVDAVEDPNKRGEMSWGERYIGSGGILTVTDYGRHRDEDDFESFIRNKIRESFPSQYLKMMDEDKEMVARELVAVSRSNGYVVLPLFK